MLKKKLLRSERRKKRSHKMILQMKTLSMLQKKLRRSKRRKERRRKLFLHPRRKKRIHKMILLQVKRSVHILPEKSGVLMPPVKS